MGTRAAIAAALASALLLWASSPSIGAGWVVWIALVPAAFMAIAAPGRAGRLAVPLAYGLYLELLFVEALPFGLAEGQWGDPVLPVLVAGSPLPLVALLLIPMLAGALYLLDIARPWPRKRLGPALEGAAVTLAPALAWAALEVLRVKLDPGGAWGPLYLSQAALPTGSLALLAGPWLITIAIVAVNYGLALALARRRIVPALAAVAAIGLAIAATSAVDWEVGDRRESLTVAAVQPGYDTAEEERRPLHHFEPGSYDRAALDLIRDLAPLTQRAASGGAELVAWPEATMYVNPRTDRRVRAALIRLSTRTGATLLVPYFLRDAGERSEALAVISDEGPAGTAARLTTSRAKQRPLWFLGERSGGNPASETLDVGVAKVGLLLGVDSIDPALPSGLAGEGAELLVAPTHDWPALAVQQRSAARLAARAAGLPLLRVDWRYGSAAYEASGEIAAEQGPELKRDLLVAELSLAAGGSPYARLGDVLAWLTLLVGALLVVLARCTPTHTRGMLGVPAR